MKKNKKRLFGIGSKLIIAFLIPVICMVVLGVVSYLSTSGAVKEQYEKSTMQTMGKSSDYLQLLLLDVESTSYDLAMDDVIISYYSKDTTGEVDYSAVQQRIKSVIGVDEYIQNGYFISTRGEHFSTNSSIVFGTDGYKKYLDSEDYLEISSRTNKLWAGRSDFLSEYLGEDSRNMFLTRSVKNVLTGEELGYLILEVRKEKIDKVLLDLDFGEDSIVMIVAQDLNESVLEEHILEDSEQKIFSNSEEFNKIMQSIDKEGSGYIKFRSSNYFKSYNYIGDTGNVLVALIPETTMLEQASSIKRLTIIFVLVAVIIAVGVGSYISTGMSKEINQMMQTVEKAALGDLTVRTSARSKDEFLDLSNSINKMIDNVKFLIGKVMEVSYEVEGAVNVVSTSSNHVNYLSIEIAKSIKEIEGGLLQQAEGSEICMESMSDLSKKIGDVASSTKEIDDISSQSKMYTASGIEKIENLKSKSVETSEITANVIEEVGILAKDVGDIFDIIDVMTQVADQITLLSLNASIEAARAGDAGRGFAVVAIEINTLADQSIKAVDQIRIIAERVNEQADKAVEKVTAADEIISSEEKVLEDVVNFFEVIDTHVGKLTLNIEDIAAGTKIIDQSKNDTVSAMESITAVAEETSAASTEINISVNKQVAEMNNLSEFSNELKDYSNKLQEAIGIFKIK